MDTLTENLFKIIHLLHLRHLLHLLADRLIGSMSTRAAQTGQVILINSIFRFSFCSGFHSVDPSVLLIRICLV